MLLSDERDGATPTGKGRAAYNATLLFDSPVWPAYDLSRREVSEMEDGGNPILDENGEPLQDEDGNVMHEQPGWRVKRDQFGRVCSDEEGQLCFEQVDEDGLALMTRSAPRQAPESLIEQVQRLQTELEEAQCTHQTDAGRAEQMMVQTEAQNLTDIRAMMAELEKRKLEYQKSLRNAKAATDQTWTTWMQQLQDDLMRQIAELRQERADQDVRYGELQQKLHVSESVAQSKSLSQSQSVPSVVVSAPPPPQPSVSY